MSKIDTFEIEGRYFCFRAAPHLRPEVDWHDAFICIIERFLVQESSPNRPVELPGYPLLSGIPRNDLLFEMGSYWEGALYFLCREISARKPLSGIQELERAELGGTLGYLGQLFMAIWNSHGQLKWLKAHYIRKSAIERGLLVPDLSLSIKEIADAARLNCDPELDWLAAFVDQHANEGNKYPNPYFGGTNPLHLGLILSAG